jgi:hypothetical protein
MSVGSQKTFVDTLQKNNNKHHLKSFVFLLLLLELAMPALAQAETYYLDAGIASSGNGKSWATAFKTIANAQAYLNTLSDKGSGDTVDVNTGFYEGYSESNVSRSNWLTYKAAKGANATFKYINISNSSQINTYLRFDGLTVKLPAPNPMPPDDGNKHLQQRMIEIAYANYVQIQNCSIIGINKYLSPGDDITNCNNFLFHHNYQTKTVSGIHGFNCNNFTVTNNYICEMSEGSGIRVDGDSTGTVFSYNHVNGCLTYQDDQYFPHNLVGTSNYHPGSGLSIKSSNTTIRNNIVHNGFSQGIMWYDTGTGYENMIMENNLFYDLGFFDGITTYTGRNHFYRVKGTLEKPDIIRNNTFISRVVDSETDKYSILSRYYAAALTMAFYGTYDGTGLTFYNNIVVGQWGLPSPLDSAVNKYVENNNIFWEQGGNAGTKNKLGDKSIFAVWLSASTLQGYPNYFEKVGESAVNTTQYNYTRDGVRPFFVNPGFYTGSVGGFADKGRSSLDYHLADNSPATNFGDSNNQPADSLGSLDANGFIRNDGPVRDKNHHSAGCYEYGPANWLFDQIGDKMVNENQTLTFAVNTSSPDIAVSTEMLPAGANFVDNTFTWTPTYAQAGLYDVNFIATDGQIEDVETVIITVNNVNRPPVIEPVSDKSVDENAALTFTIYATDPDGNNITYYAQNLPAGAAFANQTFSWTPAQGQAGTYIVNFIASDGRLEDVETVIITVNHTDNSPVINPVGDKSVDENVNLTFTVSATDPDGNDITYSAQNLPAGATFINQTFNWTPNYDQAGTYQVTFVASDGRLEDTETVTITVNNINRPPILALIGNKSVDENVNLTLTVSATDPDGDIITYVAQNLPAGATFANRTFNWMPNYDQAGTYQVTFVASDGYTQDSETITITVRDSQAGTTILSANFDSGANGFTYADDTFLSTRQPTYAKGDRISTGGYTGGALRVTLGGVDSRTIYNMSGGWKKTIATTSAATMKLSFRYKLTQSADYASDEYSQVNAAVDGKYISSTSNNFIARISGNGKGGGEITTGWRLFEITGSIAPGNHTLIIGGYNNRKTARTEWTTILIDDVALKLQ